MSKYRMDCGCEFDILNEKKDANGVPLLDFDFEKINWDCPRVWDMMKLGLTTGVFQLESLLGKQWASRLKPESIEHLAALTALLRPGTLNARDDKGVSMTEHYVKRKNGQEPANSIHEALDSILGDTYNVLVYQEQSMAIVSKLGGFSLEEADILRRAMGRKDSKLMHECQTKFITGAAKVGLITEKIAEELFDYIKKGERFCFNRSHSTGYGAESYATAYCKSHFPVQFFRAWLTFARGGQDWQEKLRGLVQDARVFGVEVHCPDIRKRRKAFYTDGKSIWFGLAYIKGISETTAVKLLTSLRNLERVHGDISNWSWMDVLCRLIPELSKGVIEGLILSGAFDWLGQTRSLMVYQYNKLAETKKLKEVCVIYKGEKTLDELLERYYNTEKLHKATAEKILLAMNLVRTPPVTLTDSIAKKHQDERYYLAIPLSVTNIERIAARHLDTDKYREYNCRSIAMGEDIQGQAALIAYVTEVRQFVVKTGKNTGREMAKLNISDETGTAALTLFSDAFFKYKDILFADTAYRFIIKRFNDSYCVEEVQNYTFKGAGSKAQDRIQQMFTETEEEDATAATT